MSGFGISKKLTTIIILNEKGVFSKIVAKRNKKKRRKSADGDKEAPLLPSKNKAQEALEFQNNKRENKGNRQIDKEKKRETQQPKTQYKL